MIATSDVADALGASARTAPMQWQRYGGRGAFHGTVCTLRCPAAAGLLRQRIEQPGHGRVLVVDAGGTLSAAVLGDRMAAIAQRNGWQGLVIHGAVRDVDSLRHMDIGVLALGATPRRGSLELAGECDVPMTLGELYVRPGEQIFCDGDGIVVCSAADARKVTALEAEPSCG